MNSFAKITDIQNSAIKLCTFNQKFECIMIFWRIHLSNQQKSVTKVSTYYNEIGVLLLLVLSRLHLYKWRDSPAVSWPIKSGFTSRFMAVRSFSSQHSFTGVILALIDISRLLPCNWSSFIDVLRPFCQSEQSPFLFQIFCNSYASVWATFRMVMLFLQSVLFIGVSDIVIISLSELITLINLIS